jgi:NMD protein affecting ribosome stability and mRNA decay
MKDYQQEIERIAEEVASRLDGRTVSSHEHFRQMVKEEVVEALRTHTLALQEEIRKKVDGIDFYGWNENTQRMIKEKIISTLTSE